mgnify:CR=1 FL=1
MKRGPKPKCRLATCSVCSREWTKPYRSCARTYCSDDCRERRKLVDLQCQECGGAYQRPHWIVGQRFCSHRCSSVHASKHYSGPRRVYRGRTRMSSEFQCRHCGKRCRQTAGPKQKGLYCSRKCAAIANRNKTKFRSLPNYTKAICCGVMAWVRLWREPKTKVVTECLLWINCEICGDRTQRKTVLQRRCKSCSKMGDKNYRHRRRCREKGGSVGRVCPARVFQRDEYACYICGRATNRNLDVNHDLYPNMDHVIPLSRGGSHTMDNLRCACRRCNLDKGPMTYNEFVSK